MRMTQLRRLREARDMRREDLASVAGVSFSTIRAHELGTAKGVTGKVSGAIAKALGVDERELFFEPITYQNVEKGAERKSECEASVA